MTAVGPSHEDVTNKKADPKEIATDDIREYVDAFRVSSDRARYALYAVIITTVLMAIANYNLQLWSWPIHRIEEWYRYARDDQRCKAAPVTKDKSDPCFVPSELLGGDPMKLLVAREEYVKQIASRSVFNASPIPGVSIDYNDLGIIGGIALVLLMIVLVICITRESENLYLALYKVRRLCSIPDKGHAQGDSKANLLYHALAMSQSLSSPPTLARWKNRGILHHFGIVFFLPVLVYLWIFYCNWKTKAVGESYKMNMDHFLGSQVILAIVLLVLSTTAWALSRAMGKRWERAFFRVNPSRQRVQQMSFWEWLRLIPGKKDSRGMQRVVTELVDTLTVEEADAKGSVSVQARRAISGPLILRADMEGMAQQLIEMGRAEAKVWCEMNHGVFRRLLRFTAGIDSNNPKANVLRGREWTVQGSWTFWYKSI